MKGAVRRVFSRSELRRQVIEKYSIEHHDESRPRVTKWVYCEECGLIFPRYLAEVDHLEPVVPLDKNLEDMTWTELVDAVWCDINNLRVVDKDCHKAKSKIERLERKRIKNEKTRS